MKEEELSGNYFAFILVGSLEAPNIACPISFRDLEITYLTHEWDPVVNNTNDTETRLKSKYKCVSTSPTYLKLTSSCLHLLLGGGWVGGHAEVLPLSWSCQNGVQSKPGYGSSVASRSFLWNEQVPFVEMISWSESPGGRVRCSMEHIDWRTQSICRPIKCG